MPGTDSNSGRCSLLYHSLNSCTCWASISTYTMKIPRPFCAICPSPLWSVAAILLPLLVGTRSARLETRRDTRHQLGSHLSGHSPDSGLLSAIFRLIEAHRNHIRAQPASFAANRSGCSPRSHLHASTQKPPLTRPALAQLDGPPEHQVRRGKTTMSLMFLPTFRWKRVKAGCQRFIVGDGAESAFACMMISLWEGT